MRLQFIMMEMGAAFFLNQQDAARYEALRQRKDLLTKQLYELMKAEHEI